MSTLERDFLWILLSPVLVRCALFFTCLGAGCLPSALIPSSLRLKWTRVLCKHFSRLAAVRVNIEPCWWTADRFAFLKFGPHCGFTTCFHTIFYCILLLVSLGHAINRGLAHAFLLDVFCGLKLWPFSKWEMTCFVNSCLVTVFMMKIFK